MTESAKPAAITLPAAHHWTGESLRLTFIFSKNPSDPSELWKDIVGSEPESVLAKPSEGSKQAQGPFENGRFTIRQSPLRIDFIYGANNLDPAKAAVSPFVEIGRLDEALEIFISKFDIMNRVGGDCVRLALGSAALVKGAGVVESNLILQYYNKDINIDPNSSTDIFYQINKPILSKFKPDLTLNRLYKWQVAEFGLLTILPNNTFATQSSASMCRLEMDLSTPPVAIPSLTKEDRSALFNELQTELKSIYFSARG